MVLGNAHRLAVAIADLDEWPGLETLRRSDFLVCVCDGTELYCELKGSDLGHAIEQVEATLRMLSPKPWRRNPFCLVIHRRSPMTAPELQIRSKRFLKRTGAQLVFRKSDERVELSEFST